MLFRASLNIQVCGLEANTAVLPVERDAIEYMTADFFLLLTLHEISTHISVRQGWRQMQHQCIMSLAIFLLGERAGKGRLLDEAACVHGVKHEIKKAGVEIT